MRAPRLHPRSRVWRAITLAAATCLLLIASAGAAFAVDPGVALDAWEPDNAVGSAKPVTVGAPPQVRTMHAMLNQDWVKFPAKAGSTYVIDSPDQFSMPSALTFAAVYSPSAVLFELVSASGEVLARSEGYYDKRFVARKPSYANEQIVWKAPAATTVYVRVTAYPGPEPQLGTYLLQVKSVVPQITGRVTTPDGNPAEFCWVSAQSGGFGVGNASALADFGPWSAAGAYTDSDGRYVLYGLDDGEYDVRFDSYWWDHEYLQTEWYDNVHERDLDTLDPRYVVVSGMKEVTGVNARLDRADTFISGSVVDESGDPIEGIRVTPLVNFGWGWSQPSDASQDVTDENGRYSVRGGWDAQWRLKFEDDAQFGDTRYAPEYWDDAPTADAGTSISVVDGVAPGSYDATLTGYDLRAQGKVTGPGGVPLEDVAVVISDAQTNSQWGYVYTDADGMWEFHSNEDLADAKVNFSDHNCVYASEWYNNQSTFESATVVPLDGETPATINAELAKYPPSLTGVVTDVHSGAKVAGVQVWLYDYTGISWYPIDSTVTDSKGFYSFPRIDEREFVVKFYDSKGFYAPEYYDNAVSPFKARWMWAELGDNLKIDVSLQPQGDRLYGANRFSTAASAAKQAFPEWAGVEHVIIASGDDAAAADPLAAGSLSWAYNAPLLLTRKTMTPADSAAALMEITDAAEGPVVIHVVGGPGSIPDARLAEMVKIVGAGNVERLPYGDRYETARQIALRVHDIALDEGRDPGVAFVANGSDYGKFFDALSASAISARTGAPILLTTKGVVPAATMKALEELDADKVYVVGGAGSVPGSAYKAMGASKRLAGADRYATSVMLAKFGGTQGWLSYSQVGLAAAMPDGATGGAAMGLLGGPMLITRSDSLPPVTYGFIDDNDQHIEHAVIFGGSSSVSGAVTQSVKQALKQ